MSCKSKRFTSEAPPHNDDLSALERAVHAYTIDYRLRASVGMRWYAAQPTLAHAVEVAALSVLRNGKRHDHQRRIPAAVLEEAKARLLAADLGRSHTFHDVFETVQREIGALRGAGELLVYDVAHRIGAFLGLHPERVYLHAGTRAGARVLGLYRGQEFLEPTELPEPLRRLSPEEVEDLLCIYKGDLLGAPSS